MTLLYFRVSLALTSQANESLSSHRRARQMERRKRTNRMLISVSIIFFVSWAPLNLFNIFIDIFEPFVDNTEGTKQMLIIFAVCHLSAMSSVCSNPIMYGFLNENFKQSFHYLIKKCPLVEKIIIKVSKPVSSYFHLISKH